MNEISRREFLKTGGTALGGSWVTMHMPVILAVGQAACTARESAAAFENIDADTARDLEAVAAQIIPSGDTPGAREAGVIYFIDKALGGFMAGAAPAVTAGVAELNDAAATKRHGRFADMDFAEQTELLKAHEQGPLFQILLFLTKAGMFAMPAHGGNRDHLGWQLLGFEHQHVWNAPYGFYDAQAGGEDHDDA